MDAYIERVLIKGGKIMKHSYYPETRDIPLIHHDCLSKYILDGIERCASKNPNSLANNCDLLRECAECPRGFAP
jgi:hypothetical protein